MCVCVSLGCQLGVRPGGEAEGEARGEARGQVGGQPRDRWPGGVSCHTLAKVFPFPYPPS